MSRDAWRSVSFLIVALTILASTFVASGNGPASFARTWVFIGVYVITGLWCLRNYYLLGVMAALAVIWVRLDVTYGHVGLEFRFSSALFAVLFFALAVRGADCERNRTP